MSKNTSIILGLVVLILLLAGGFLLLSQPAQQTQCIVTVFGEKYDVTSLQSAHSGGNVFECGTDMSEVFESQHGSDVSRIESYKIEE